MIVDIESEWRETPLVCPKCKPGPLYSDGLHRPQCPSCFHKATDAEIYGCLIRPTPAELQAEYDANELRNMLKIVWGKLARGRRVGANWRQGALDAENFIIDLIGAPGSPPV